MTKVIRDKTSGAFLTEKGQWTNDILKARHFRRAADALAARLELQLDGVELYYSFGDDHFQDRWDFAIPIA